MTVPTHDHRLFKAQGYLRCWMARSGGGGADAGYSLELALWLAGLDTMEISKRTKGNEADVCRELSRCRDIHGTLKAALL